VYQLDILSGGSDGEEESHVSDVFFSSNVYVREVTFVLCAAFLYYTYVSLHFIFRT
jgi:hypothetical protein